MYNIRNNQNFKKSVENFMSIWANLKKEEGTSLKNALYNFLIVLLLLLITGIVLVLGPFFKPLLWAFLFGK